MVGAVPGTVLPNEQATPTILEKIVYSKQDFRVSKTVDLSTLADVTSGTQWVNIIGLADQKAIETLGDIFGIHPLILEDIVHTHQRPKSETVQERLIVMMRMTDQQIPLQLEQVTLVLCGRTVLSFQEHAGDPFESVRHRIRNSLGRIREHGSDYLIYCLIDAVLDAYFPLLEQYGRMLETLEDSVTDSPGATEQLQIRDAKRELAHLRKTTWAHRDTMQRLLQSSDEHFSDHTRLFLRDCVDHAAQIVDVTESFREVVADLRELYFTSISQRTNDVMKLLTIISTIFIPMSFVAGLYGMNFDSKRSPYNMPETEWRYGYPFALFLMAIIASTMLFGFYRRGWFRRD